ncbi:MAG: Zn-ribbon domain-containing OB-fold protein [Planctomycetota bacterium]|jgi:hypothetical protein|nr:Zn-ribbon domain-containing OB-fold protein [Planctomycetota bacterium]
MELDKVEPIAVEGRIKIPYRWPSGQVGDLFLTALKEEGKIIGLRCPKCKTVTTPPRPRCFTCLETSEEWVEVGPEGEVTTWTVSEEGEIVGLIQLDGSDTALLHTLLVEDFSQVQPGMRVKAVYNEKKKGSVRDIKGFEPTEVTS